MDTKTPAENWQIIQERWNGTRAAPGSDFDSSPTAPIVAFEVVVLLAFAAACTILPRFTNRVFLRFAVLAVAVLTFEMFTAPMWRNLRMGSWAYLFQQISWILTIGWCTVILCVTTLVDHLYRNRSEARRFCRSIALLTPLVFVFEIILTGIGLRSYSPEVLESVSGITFSGVPLEALYYVPVFMTLVISFYKFWMTIFGGEPIAPIFTVPLARIFAAALIGILLFELMIEPMVLNTGFPAWSYLYRDISVIMTGIWVLLLWASISSVEKLLPHWDSGHRFLAYLAVLMIFAVPVEGWLIQNGFRSYGPSASANFSGLTLPWTAVPIEVVFAIPLYFGLVIGFVRYAELSRLELEGDVVR